MPNTRTAGDSGAATEPPGLGTVVIDDLRHGSTLAPAIRRDLRHLYDFYLDDEQRERLARMNRAQAALYLSAWLLREMFLRLPAPRRMLLLAAFACLFLGRIEFTFGRIDINLSFLPGAFALVLVVLMLELKDRLLAHDELSIGRQVQVALLPKAEPVVPGWSIWIYTRPANHVGGDLIDFLPLQAGAAGLALGDVAGKGLGAALLMAKLQATLRAIAPEYDHLGEVGARLNRTLCRDGLPNRFATLVYAHLEPGSGAVRVLNAGHVPPVVLSAHGADRLLAPALPLGITLDAAFDEQRLSLQTGEMLVVYSDGLSEATNAAGEFYGEQRLHQVWTALRGSTAAAAGRILLADVEQFIAGAPQEDDLSLLVIQRTD